MEATIIVRVPVVVANLTPAEMEACRLLASGADRTRIAKTQRITMRTVNKHLLSARHKMGCQTEAAMGAVLALAGLIQATPKAGT